MTQLARQVISAVWSGTGIGLLITGLLVSIAMLCIGIYQMTIPANFEILFGGPSPAHRVACDRAVASLLSTDNLVELERSKFLIGELNCSVKRRLPG